MSIPAFIDVAESDQILELRIWLKEKGAEISEENSEHGFLSDLSQLIEASDIVWKESGNDTESEAVFNSIINLVLLMPDDKKDNIVISLCEKVVKVHDGDHRSSPTRLRVLSNLFHGLDERSAHRYTVYLAMIQLAGQAEIITLLGPNLERIKEWVAQWDVSSSQVQNMLRALHDAFLENKQSENATKVMIELLGTYTEDNASQARDDAHRCIVTCLADPDTFLMDHLLTLKPVKFLEGELIHDLLTIFVTNKLVHYMQFYHQNQDFVESLGLSHDQNLHKMRVLTFMQISETHNEIEFETIQQEMKLDEEDVEAFIIDVVRTKTVRAKIDHNNRKVIISSTTHRTFGKQQWQLLREELQKWHTNLSHVQTSLQTVTPP